MKWKQTQHIYCPNHIFTDMIRSRV